MTSSPSFWRRRLLDPIRDQLTQGITPEKVALTLSLGAIFGLFPVMGTTSLLCFLAALSLRLNQPIIQIVNQLLWPAHLLCILPCIRLGEHLTGSSAQPLNLVAMTERFWAAPGRFLREFGSTIGHAILGWLVVAPVLAIVLYVALLPLLRRAATLSTRLRSGPTPS